MPQDKLEASYFSPDILEFIKLLHVHRVRYVVVGGEAVIYYGHARLTGDIDFFYDSSPVLIGQAHFAALGACIAAGAPHNCRNDQPVQGDRAQRALASSSEG